MEPHSFYQFVNRMPVLHPPRRQIPLDPLHSAIVAGGDQGVADGTHGIVLRHAPVGFSELADALPRWAAGEKADGGGRYEFFSVHVTPCFAACLGVNPAASLLLLTNHSDFGLGA